MAETRSRRRGVPASGLRRAARTAGTTAALAGVLAAAVSAQQEAVEGATASPTLSTLAQRVSGGDSGSVATFWAAVERSGAPLVEPDAERAGHSIVTFVARTGPDVHRVRLASNLTALMVDGSFPSPDSLGWLRRLEGTDVWYLSFRLRNDVRVPYRLEIHRRDRAAEVAVDPLNRETWEPGVDGLRASILELPGAAPQPWRNASGEEGAGDWDELTDEATGRSVYVYRPVAWDSTRAAPYPVLIGLGAFGHGIGMRVDRMVDELIEAGRLPPLVVALVDLTAADEAARYGSTADFLLGELLPHVRTRYRVSADPSNVVVSGTSRRGVVAALLALEHPESFGNVLSLSGSYYWRPEGESEFEWIPRRFAEGDVRPVRFHLAAGELETFVSPGNRGHYLVATNRHMRDVLRARGYDLEYVEFNGVHSELNWADALAAGLVRLVR